jgi:trigger factor
VFEYFQQNPEAMAQIRAPIFEEKVVDFIAELATVSEKSVSLEELMVEPGAEDEDKPKAKKPAAKKKAAPKKAAAKKDDGEAKKPAKKAAAKKPAAKKAPAKKAAAKKDADKE